MLRHPHVALDSPCCMPYIYAMCITSSVLMNKTPLIALLVVTLALTAGFAYAYNVALSIPATVNVVDTPTYWTSDTSAITLGDTYRDTDSGLTLMRITNGGTTAQVLHVAASGLGAGNTLIVKNTNLTPYTDTAIAAGGFIDLYVGVHVGVSAVSGLDTFSVDFTTPS